MFKKSRRELINQAVEYIEFDARAWAEEVVTKVNKPNKCYIADIVDYYGIVRHCLVFNQLSYGDGRYYDLTKYFPVRTRNNLYCFISYEGCNENNPPSPTSWCSITGTSANNTNVSTIYPNCGSYNTKKIFTNYRTYRCNGSIQSLNIYSYSANAPDPNNAPVYIDLNTFKMWVTDDYQGGKSHSAYTIEYALQNPILLNSSGAETAYKLLKTDDGYYYENINAYSFGEGFWQYPFRMLANVQYYMNIDVLVKNDYSSNNTVLENNSKLKIVKKDDMSVLFQRYIVGAQEKTVNSGNFSLPKVTEDTDILFSLNHYGRERTYFKNFRVFR